MTLDRKIQLVKLILKINYSSLNKDFPDYYAELRPECYGDGNYTFLDKVPVPGQPYVTCNHKGHIYVPSEEGARHFRASKVRIGSSQDYSVTLTPRRHTC